MHQFSHYSQTSFYQQSTHALSLWSGGGEYRVILNYWPEKKHWDLGCELMEQLLNISLHYCGKNENSLSNLCNFHKMHSVLKEHHVHNTICGPFRCAWPLYCLLVIISTVFLLNWALGSLHSLKCLINVLTWTRLCLMSGITDGHTLIEAFTSEG